MSIAWTPHAGQKLGMKFLLSHPSAALFASPGTGKTTIVYGAFKILQKKKFARKMLVIAPLKPAHLVWGPEASKWTDFEHLRVEVLHGPDKDAALARDADVYVINPDGLDWLLDARRTTNARGKVSVTIDLKGFKALGFDTLVLDELTLWKHTGSGRHKALKQVIATFQRRWGLTGTPAPNGLQDLFGQVYMLDMGRAFGPFVTHFRNEFFVPSFDGYTYHLARDAEKRIYERLRPLVLRLEATDYVDMPMVVPTLRKFPLPAGARKLYDKLEEDMIAEMHGVPITAVTAAALSTKIRQIASGGIYIDELMVELLGKKVGKMEKIEGSGRPWLLVHNEKTEMLDDLTEELNGEPLLVAYEFHHDLARIEKWYRNRFKEEIPNIGSGVAPKRSAEIEREWNAGNLPVLAGHPRSMGHGLNLQQSGNQIAWYSTTWDLELYDQLIARVARQGSKHKRVFVHHFVAEKTIDETIYFVLNSKRKTQNALLEALKIIKRR